MRQCSFFGVEAPPTEASARIRTSEVIARHFHYVSGAHRFTYDAPRCGFDALYCTRVGAAVPAVGVSERFQEESGAGHIHLHVVRR